MNYLRANQPVNRHVHACPRLIELPEVGESHVYVTVTHVSIGRDSHHFGVY